MYIYGFLDIKNICFETNFMFLAYIEVEISSSKNLGQPFWKIACNLGMRGDKYDINQLYIAIRAVKYMFVFLDIEKICFDTNFMFLAYIEVEISSSKNLGRPFWKIARNLDTGGDLTCVHGQVFFYCPKVLPCQRKALHHDLQKKVD